MSIETTVVEIARAGRKAAREIARVSADQKNAALLAIAETLEKERNYIQSENQKDLNRAREAGLSAAMIDRLAVKDATLASMAAGLRDVVGLADPVGTMSPTWLRPNGLQRLRGQPVSTLQSMKPWR